MPEHVDDFPIWVSSSSSQDGEAAVRRRLTAERQVTRTLQPVFIHQATGRSGRTAEVGAVAATDSMSTIPDGGTLLLMGQ